MEEIFFNHNVMTKIQIKNILVSGLSGAVSAVLVFVLLTYSGFAFETGGEEVQTNNDLQEFLSERDFVSEQDLVVDAVEKASPAVVSILITKDVPVLERYYEDSSDPFERFFYGPGFRVPRYRDSGETERQEIGGGSGFLVSEDGYIVTNRHVVDEEEVDYVVFTSDGTEYEATVVDRDTLNDIAILKIEGEDFSYLNFADSAEARPGQTVIAIGNPLLEFNNSVSVGVVSGLSRNITAGDRFYGKTEYIENLIQTDAAINPGNSGGPLLDLNGDVLAVNVAVASAENIGFSIPSSAVEPLVQSVKDNGKIVRPFLGIRYVQITAEMQERNDLPVDHGVIVLRGAAVEDLAVIPGSPADKAGIVENDIILEIDGEPLKEGVSLAKIVAAKSIGDQVELKVLRDGEEELLLNVTLESSE